MLSGRLHDRHETLQAFADRAIDVALGKRFGGRRKHRDFLDPGSDGVFKPAKVGGERAVSHPGFTLDLREDIRRARHLRYPFGRDETADFYIAQAGSRQRVDQLYLVGNADGLGFILQTVARADFDKAYMGREGHGVRPVLIVRRTL